MAATVQDVTESASTGTGSGSLTVSYPASLSAGDLLLMIGATYHSTASNVNTPSGWTALWNQLTSNLRGWAFARVIADSTEAASLQGTTFTLQCSSGNFGAAVQIHRIGSFAGTIATDITYPTPTTAATVAIDPPSENASYSNEDTLFIAGGSIWNGSQVPNASVSMTNYTDYTRTVMSGGTNRANVLSWRRTVIGSDSDDPPASGSLGSGYTMVRWTVAIRGTSIQNVTDVGAISSAEAEGTPTIQATTNLSGVASAEAVGTPAIQSNVPLTGVASAEAVGGLTVSPQPVSITLTGIASAEAVGDPTAIAIQVVSLTAVDSAEAVGGLAVSPQAVNITLTAIDSAEAVGDVSIASQIALTGVASAEAVGTITLQAYLALTGVTSAEAVGTSMIELTVTFTGIASAEAFGSLTVNQIQIVSLTGIGSAEAFGSLLIRSVLTLAGIASAEAVGTINAQRTVTFSGVGSLEAVGGLSITAGAVTITLAGVPSSEAVGLLSALKAVVGGKELPPGLSFQVVIIPGGSGAPVALSPGGAFTQQLPPGGS